MFLRVKAGGRMAWGFGIRQFRGPKRTVHSGAHCVKLGAMNRILFALMILAAGMAAAAENTKVVFLAGPPSHGRGEHEHRAGCLLLKSCLDQVPGVTSEVYSNGWPQNPEAAFAGAATLVVYSDGGSWPPLAPGRPPEDGWRPDEEGRRAGLHPLRRGTDEGEGREGIPGLDRRVLRDRLVGEPDLAAGVSSRCPHTPSPAG